MYVAQTYLYTEAVDQVKRCLSAEWQSVQPCVTKNSFYSIKQI
jgi:hypothetical protein